MKKNNYKNLLIITLVLFAGLFTYRVQQCSVTGLIALKAYADTGDESDEEEIGQYSIVAVYEDFEVQFRDINGRRYVRTRTCYTVSCSGYGTKACVDTPPCTAWSPDVLAGNWFDGQTNQFNV